MLSKAPFAGLAGSIFILKQKARQTKLVSLTNDFRQNTRFRLRYWGGLVGLAHLHA